MAFIDEVIAQNRDTHQIGYVTDELLKVITTVSSQDNKEKCIHGFLDQYMAGVDLTLSFDNKLAFIYDEAITVEIFLAIYTWFLRKSCNITNIQFITTHTMGLAEWFTQYQILFGVIGFTVIEAPFHAPYVPEFVASLKGTDQVVTHKNLMYYFDYYGGTRNSIDKDFLVTVFASCNYPRYVDYKAGFISTIVEFDNYLEEISGFCDREMCDRLIKCRSQLDFNYTNAPVDNQSRRVITADFNQSINDRCGFHILRETYDTQPFLLVTEKTLKAFVQMQIPIPLGFNSVSRLETVGFKFDHTLVDYSYQQEPIFYKRMSKIINELNRLCNQYSLNELAERIYNNKDILEHNYKYVKSGELVNILTQRLFKELND